MERLKPHSIQPGTTGQVLTTGETGDPAWADLPEPPEPVVALDDLSDVDTGTTPPVHGQALIWDNDLGQWVPGSGGEVIVGQPSVSAARTTWIAGGAPYDVPLPAGIDSTFVGKFVVVCHWSQVTDAVIGELVALPDWDVLAWTGVGPDGFGPVMAILGGDPRNLVSVNAGNGVCEFSVLAVADAGEFRSPPPQSNAPLVISTADSATGWSSPSDTTVVQADGYVMASAGMSSTEWYTTAVLDLTGPVDFTGYPIMVVEWAPGFADPSINLNASTTRANLGRMGCEKIRTTDIGGGWWRTVFAVRAGETTSIRFVADGYGNGGPGYDLFIRNVEAHPSPNGWVSQAVSSSGVTIEDGVAMEVGDLFILAGGTSPADIELYNDANGEHLVAADSNPGNDFLTTRTWAILPAAAAMNVRPYGVSTGPQVAGLAAVGISVIGTSTGGGTPGGGGGGGLGLPTGASEGDILMVVDGEAAWVPPPDGLPEGGLAGQVLTLVDGEPVWQTPTTPPATSYLVPLTTLVDGVPTLVWDENFELVYVMENF